MISSWRRGRSPVQLHTWWGWRFLWRPDGSANCKIFLTRAYDHLIPVSREREVKSRISFYIEKGDYAFSIVYCELSYLCVYVITHDDIYGVRVLIFVLLVNSNEEFMGVYSTYHIHGDSCVPLHLYFMPAGRRNTTSHSFGQLMNLGLHTVGHRTSYN